MTTPKMHADEIHTDEALVRRLLAVQFSRWADLPLARVPSSGTDNAIYRLGDELAVRMPRIGWAAGQVERDARWLPSLAPRLPLAIHAPLALGEPGEGYPWRWGVYPWLEGENATAEYLHSLDQAAADLAGFITALQSIDATDGPRAGPENFQRGVPLAARDAGMRRAITALEGMADTAAITAAWEQALAARAWDGPPVWLHGDLTAGNLLARDGQLAAVIDFGCLGVGDPAADLIPAWNLFTGTSREVFRRALSVDDATWARGRGCALTAIGGIPYYQHTNPAIVAAAWRTLREVLADAAARTA